MIFFSFLSLFLLCPVVLHLTLMLLVLCCAVASFAVYVTTKGKNRHGPKMASVIRNANRMSYLFQQKQLLQPHKNNPLTIRKGDGVADIGTAIMEWAKTEIQCFSMLLWFTPKEFLLTQQQYIRLFASFLLLFFPFFLFGLKVQEVCCFVRNTFYTYFST